VRHAFKPDGTDKQRRARTGGAGADERDGRHWYCAACTTRVAREEAAIEVAGAHRHRFANPAGVEFELGCFAEAACRVEGEPTLAFTWFAGCGWSYALCFNCRAHLGWCYEGDGVRFFGLIVTRLVGPI
jgi:hypothetical protein